MEAQNKELKKRSDPVDIDIIGIFGYMGEGKSLGGTRIVEDYLSKGHYHESNVYTNMEFLKWSESYFFESGQALMQELRKVIKERKQNLLFFYDELDKDFDAITSKDQEARKLLKLLYMARKLGITFIATGHDPESVNIVLRGMFTLVVVCKYDEKLDKLHIYEYRLGGRGKRGIKIYKCDNISESFGHYDSFYVHDDVEQIEQGK